MLHKPSRICRSVFQSICRNTICGVSALLMMGCAVPSFAQTESIVHYFHPPIPGTNPLAGLVEDSSGNLYGTTLGAKGNAGTAFRFAKNGSYTVLHTFTGGQTGSKDGCIPRAALIRDAAGNLYGTTSQCGSARNAGIVFKLDAAGKETILYTFTGGADGGTPLGSLLRDQAGNLYGTASAGGDSSCHFYGSNGCGTIFSISPAGEFSLLHTFTGEDGAAPLAGLIRDSAGNFYGTAGGGGTGFNGTVYKMDKAGNVTVLDSFYAGDNPDGWLPASTLVRDSAGNFYGTTQNGGSNPNLCNGFGCGSVFKLDPSGNETLLYSFGGNFDGQIPSSLVMDAEGNLYGETQGSDSVGTVFKIDPLGNETVLHEFIQGSTDGQNPCCNLVMDGKGNLWGTTQFGGSTNAGTIFKVTTTD